MNKVWTYIISKELTPEELNEISDLGKKFVSGWTAHENPLSANFVILNKRIIIIQVNEEVSDASGCSIDKLLRFIKQIESDFKIELLNRFLVAYKNNDTIEVVHSSKIRELLASQTINENTIVLNTSVATGEELKQWEQPLKNTWLNKYLATV